MSRSRLFLGGLRSRRARLRFNGRLHLALTGRIRKPGLRKVAHFSTGIMPHFQPELTVGSMEVQGAHLMPSVLSTFQLYPGPLIPSVGQSADRPV